MVDDGRVRYPLSSGTGLKMDETLNNSVFEGDNVPRRLQVGPFRYLLL